VAIPFGTGVPYDLIVDTRSRLLKIQVKTGWFSNGSIIYKGERRIREANPYATRPYTESEVDYFAVYYPPSKSIFVVPFSVCNGRGNLRLESSRNGQQKLIKWANDFSWEKHIEELQSEASKVFRYVEPQFNSCDINI
jgi:hypothetical protein